MNTLASPSALPALSAIGRTAVALTLTALGLAGAPAHAARGSYGYVRTLDGPATLVQADSGVRERAETNQPILTGDRLLLPSGSRAEVVLSDSNLVAIDGPSDVEFERLALSPDSDARSTVLRVVDGELRVEVDETTRGVEPPSIETSNATVYLSDLGVYRITSERDGWSEVVVREGSAEVETDRGSAIVRERELAEIDGDRRPRVRIGRAPSTDSLERWADLLRDEAYRYADRSLDDDLRYQAAPLGRYGSWLTIEGRRVWRPRVSSGWRPYSLGRWVHTPAGLTWISSESWGWVPYHYGTWDYYPSAGWCWIPGRVFAPAWVYWYWGPTYVGWCPIGYYTRRHAGYGYRHGIYGWAGGDWRRFSDWNFVATVRLGGRFQHGDIRPGRELGVTLERGILTTDTRALPRDRWNQPGVGIEVFRRGRELPDVSEFVDRNRDLPAHVRRVVVDERPNDDLTGTPFRPETLGREADGRAPGGVGVPGASESRERSRRDAWNGRGDGERIGQPAPDLRGAPERGVDRSERSRRDEPAGEARDHGRERGEPSSPYVGQPAPRDGGEGYEAPRARRAPAAPDDNADDDGRGVGRRERGGSGRPSDAGESSPYVGQPAPSGRRTSDDGESERAAPRGRGYEAPREREQPPAESSRDSGRTAAPTREAPRSDDRPRASAPSEPSGSSEPPPTVRNERGSRGSERGAERGSSRGESARERSRPSQSGEAGGPPPGR